MLFEEIRRIRTPLFRNISRVDKTSELYLLYKKQALTPNNLMSSTENIFIVAFIYNELFDIKDYLGYLTGLTITNQSYNVIKHYLKEICTIKLSHKKDSKSTYSLSHHDLKDCKDFLDSFFNNCNKSKDNIQTIILKILQGELYRMVKIPVDDFDPYFFIGYCTIGDILLPNFEYTFDIFITKSTNILKVLNDFGFYDKTDNDQPPQSIRSILRHLEICMDCLVTENILNKVIEYISFDSIDLDLIRKICSHKAIQKVTFEKLMNISDNEKYLASILSILCDVDIYKAIKDHTISRIRKLSHEPFQQYILEFLLTYLYHEPNGFDYQLFNEICDAFSLTDTVEYKLITKQPGLAIDKDIFYKIRNCKDFSEITKLFASFIYFCTFNELILDDQLLELPEKFFNIGLSAINSETARNLKIFNDNPLSERLRKTIFLKIDKSIFIRYLIKRYKIFNEIDFSTEEYLAYESLMDDKYKTMYALYDLKWASKHIKELNRIGISDKLYYSLKGSPFKDCLVNISLKGIQQSEAEKNTGEIKNISFNPENNETKRMKTKNASENTSSQCFNILNSPNNSCSKKTAESATFNKHSATITHQAQDYDLSSPHVLQSVYDAFKNECMDFTSLICKIQTSDEHADILKSLFRWSNRTKYFMYFLEFYKQSVIRFDLVYEDIKSIILELVKKFKDIAVIRLSAYSLSIKDMYDFINDFANYNAPVVEGIGMKIDKNPNSEEYHSFIYSLIHSMSFNFVVVGSKLYSRLNNPTFNLDHLLTYKSDDVLFEVVNQLKVNPGRTSNYNETLLDILYSRGLTDELSALICKKLYIPDLPANDLQRIYSLFYINPLNYIKYDIYLCGFSLDEHIVIDLIKSLSKVYSEEFFMKISEVLSTYQWTQSCFDQMILSLESTNFLFKNWVFDNLNTQNISLPFFIKLCWFIGNEDDVEVLKKALIVLKKGKVYDIIDSWAKMKKFDRLTGRVYPLRLQDTSFYKRIFDKIQDEDEKRMLQEMYDLSTI